MPPEKDITDRKDIEWLLQSFYNKLLADPSINYLFTDIAGIDIKTHLPLLADFWEMVLFQTGGYKNNAIQKHLELHRKSPLTSLHFDTWLRYFEETIDEHFAGDNALLAKQRANSVATIIRIKISQTS